MRKINYKILPTEIANPRARNLDCLTVREIVNLMNREDQNVPKAVTRVATKISSAVNMIVRSINSGGRLFFVGAGTSGRLGVMESAELPPTFGTSSQLAQAIMAGGKKAVFRSQEGAEDNVLKAKTEIQRRIRKRDVVIGIAASGVTPFVQSALSHAKRKKATTILITCNPRRDIGRRADIVIAPDVGPEIIAGSTRMKSATATKMILNMLTTASMIKLGKVYGNRMVDMQPKSKKLQERALRLVQEIAEVPRETAIRYLREARNQVKIAILMAKKKFTYDFAVRKLKKCGGFLAASLSGR